MSFRDDFLKRQADPNDLGAIVQRQGSAIAQAGQAFVRMQRLDEITADMGDQRAGRFISSETGGEPTSQDFSGVFLSAALQAIADGNAARFAEVKNGIAQFWVADGAAWAGRGAVKLYDDGVLFSNAGDALVFYDDAYSQYAVISMRPSGSGGALSIRIYGVASESNLLANGDFASGDLTGWTETDPGGAISVVELDEGGYALHFVGPTVATNYLTQVISAANGVVITFRARARGAGPSRTLHAGPSASMQNLQVPSDDIWRNFTLLHSGVVSDFKITAVVSNGNELEVADITVRATGTNTAYVNLLPGGIFMGGPFEFNPEQLDLGFILNGVNDSLLFYLDTANDRIGIGKNDPAYKFDVNGEINATGLRINGNPVSGADWTAVTETWTRTGNHTFTVPGDLTATYRKGAKIRYKDGGAYEYGVVQSSSYSSPDTTVTLIANSDYAMAAATITDTTISYIETPEGFPVEFSFTPSINAGLTLGNGTMTGKIVVIGQKVNGRINVIAGSTTAITSAISFNYPAPHATFPDARLSLGVAVFFDASAAVATQVLLGNTIHNGSLDKIVPQHASVSGTGVYLVGAGSLPFTIAASDEISLFFEYPIG